MPLSSLTKAPSAYFKPISLHHVDVLPTARIGLLLPYHCCTESFNIPPTVSYVIAVSLLINKSDFDKSIALSAAVGLLFTAAANGVEIIAVTSNTLADNADNSLFKPLSSFV